MAEWLDTVIRWREPPGDVAEGLLHASGAVAASFLSVESRGQFVELLRELLDLQHDRGYLDEAALREVAQRSNVPLYRLEELVSFYPHFRRTPPPGRTIEVCRDGVCAMADCAAWQARLADRLAGRGMALMAIAFMGGPAVLQSLGGAIIGAFPAANGQAPAVAYQALFAFLAAVVALAALAYGRVPDAKPSAGFAAERPAPGD